MSDEQEHPLMNGALANTNTTTEQLIAVISESAVASASMATAVEHLGQKLNEQGFQLQQMSEAVTGLTSAMEARDKYEKEQREKTPIWHEWGSTLVEAVSKNQLAVLFLAAFVVALVVALAAKLGVEIQMPSHDVQELMQAPIVEIAPPTPTGEAGPDQ